MNVTDCTHYVYALTDPRNGDVRYVGLSVNPWMRLSSHRNPASSNILKVAWINELRAAGLVPTVRILQTCCGREDGRARELAWIRSFSNAGRPLCNMVYPGMGWKAVHKAHGVYSKYSFR